ncbi:MAG: ribulokinase [Verrucomicrobiota bacterium]|nr:ribulokinase [Verrucomicrobiota bacterium]
MNKSCSQQYSIGIDYGTSSVRSIVVNCGNGQIIGSSVFEYSHGENGVITDDDPNLSRQHPLDYIDGLKQTVKNAVSDADIDPDLIIGIGVDATASTPIPLNENGDALVFDTYFSDKLSALAWLWKDHTSLKEAEEITNYAQKIRPEYLTACGGVYSSEWFWAKILNCLRNDPEVFNAADSWMELQDWIPFLLTGNRTAGLCAAGHKGLYSNTWGGFPDDEFLNAIDNRLLKVKNKLPKTAKNIGQEAGKLNFKWAKELLLPEGIPVAIGTIDAHAGAIGTGVKPGVMVKILGTSTCDIAITPITKKIPNIPGICGIAYESVLPNYFGIEAGQSAVGDIFNWFVNKIQPGEKLTHSELNDQALEIQPGTSGLLSLDWNNGNRSILTDPKLSGLIIGTTLQTTPAEIYRSLVEATAFGARIIIEQLKNYDVKIDRIINCGGIAEKSPLVMQIYADVLNYTMEISSNSQSCALGAAIAAAVVGNKYDNFEEAIDCMTMVDEKKYIPNEGNKKIYDQLFLLYKQLHDAFGEDKNGKKLNNVMKDLIKIRNQTRVGE